MVSLKELKCLLSLWCFQIPSKPIQSDRTTQKKLSIISWNDWPKLSFHEVTCMWGQVRRAFVRGSVEDLPRPLISKLIAIGLKLYISVISLCQNFVLMLLKYPIPTNIWVFGLSNTRELSCINAIQHGACRFFLGVGKTLQIWQFERIWGGYVI